MHIKRLREIRYKCSDRVLNNEIPKFHKCSSVTAETGKGAGAAELAVVTVVTQLMALGELVHLGQIIFLPKYL